MKYTTLFFDADDTLLDFHAAEEHALELILRDHNIPFNEDTHTLYSRTNQEYWEAFERGEIPKSAIFVGRYKTFLERSGYTGDAEAIAKGYEEYLSRQPQLIAGAFDILKKLAAKYDVYILTNGAERVQERRLKDSGIADAVKGVFVSETVGVPKPEKGYFDYVFKNIRETDKQKILLIGDSQSSDILGGINAGIDTCWYNPRGKSGKYSPTYEIKDLSELEKMLDC